MQVDDGGEVELALAGGDLSHVAAPGDVRSRRGELPADQVRRDRALALPGQRPAAPLDAAGQAQLGHGLRDGVLRHPPPAFTQLDMDTWGAVGAARGVDGHALQLHAVHRRFLSRLAAHTPLLPDAGKVAFIDVDSTHKRVFGPA